MQESVPNNAGIFRPLKVVAPHGTPAADLRAARGRFHAVTTVSTSNQ
jgi:hypothetical protein